MPELLRLFGLDEEDLAVFSANLQDALVKASDMAYLPRSMRFALVAARFDWVRAGEGATERCRVGVHFERVLKVSHIGFDPNNKDLVLNLLGIIFEPGDAPAGRIVLTFSGGAAIAIEVECIEAQLRDIGPRWKTKMQPGHPIDAETDING